MTSKEKLIKATVEVISRNGLYSVTTAKIAGQAELSEAMIYRHFGNKDEMIIDSFLWIKGEMNRFVVSKMSSEGDIKEQCYKIWLAHIDFFINNPKYLRVLSQFEHSHFMTDRIRKECLDITHRIITFFQNGIDGGIFKRMPLDLAVSLFFSPILSMAESILGGRLDRSDEILQLAFCATMDALSCEKN